MNYQHIMPTRYTLDVDLKTAVPTDVLGNQERKEEARKVTPTYPLGRWCMCLPRTCL